MKCLLFGGILAITLCVEMSPNHCTYQEVLENTYLD